MIRIIDNTLTAFDDRLPSKEDLHIFCELLLIIGVDMIELSIAAFEKMECLPGNDKYVLKINYAEEIERYPGFYRYVCHNEVNREKVISEIQINDTREIIKLHAFDNCKELRIVGLDDLVCRSYDNIISEINRILPDSKINFCPENTYGCASALAVQWVLNVKSDITTSFAGCNNNAATEEVLMALRLAIRHKPNRDLTVLPKLTSLFENITNTTISNNKSVIGKNIFKVESGIHTDGINKNPATYEPYSPSCVGGKSEIVIGKHSGIKAIKLKMEEMEMQIPKDIIIKKILDTVKSTCTQNRKSLKDEEFLKLSVEVIANEGE